MTTTAPHSAVTSAPVCTPTVGTTSSCTGIEKTINGICTTSYSCTPVKTTGGCDATATKGYLSTMSVPSSTHVPSTKPWTMSTAVRSTSKADWTRAASTSNVASATSATSAYSTFVARNWPADKLDTLRDNSISKLESYLAAHPAEGSCTLENATVRKEYGDLTDAERAEYINAVLCLQSLPAKSGKTYPGAKTRYDDFVALHIDLTPDVHNTANFLTWHRYFTWSYEQALKNECGYTGAQPYWNWNRYASSPSKSPIFNGNATSMSAGPNNECVTEGPFVDMKVNLGPGSSTAYNPRCLKRNISTYWSKFTTIDYTYPLVTEQNTITGFQNTMQVASQVHAGGHFTFGGDPGGDIYASPGDPVFFIHHSGIDRLYWLWQLQDLPTRLTAVGGSVAGSSATGALTDVLDMGVVNEDRTIGDMMNTMGGNKGAFCYIYT
ncbi:hypothetical protein TD95_005463 [Thielaviopsis punctulata]|uniref:Tyrosinase copper-binding domain-containing protein n=1 Tax=Thielaviopsis punctulata TaxID=72032 RepID=A0A0F4ZCE5_9PEZI|nr:hypothetical protein TD95_005463 [Thielaviopsis punctulata]